MGQKNADSSPHLWHLGLNSNSDPAPEELGDPAHVNLSVFLSSLQPGEDLIREQQSPGRRWGPLKGVAVER